MSPLLVPQWMVLVVVVLAQSSADAEAASAPNKIEQLQEFVMSNPVMGWGIAGLIVLILALIFLSKGTDAFDKLVGFV
ncbi:MAG: hypothetical protein AAF327_25525, partial [Cyanobacteria bacterium P01_A01_bin.37]